MHPIFTKVKENGKIKMNSIVSVFGLVLLLLLSPCKVRNFIQTELGIPTIKVPHKSKSTISQSDCQTFEVAVTFHNILKPNFQQGDFLISDISFSGFTNNFFKHTFIFDASKNREAVDVPLYILYQNLKIYS